MNWKGKDVSIVGLGVSNQALIRFLVRRGASVTARDQKSREELGGAVEPLAALGVELRLGPDYLDGLDRAEAIFLTPGMRKDLPEIVRARARGVPISTEVNLFLETCKAPAIGVTGSSGKTTTTTLIGAVLEASGLKVFVGGNIGRPLIEQADEIPERAIVVLELSSFQLELVTRSPRVAVITNITPNHLDIHETMEAYIEAKKRIFAHQSDHDLLVLNWDDPIVRKFASETPARIAWFSRREEVEEGAFVSDGRVMIARAGRSGRTLIDVCPVEAIPLLGLHNLENVLAACAVGDALGATPGTMREVVTSFTGVAHRLELVREAAGVRYYNDSIATTPARAAAGLRAFDRPVLLIAGGYDKRLPFDEFAEVVVEKAKAVFLIGETAPKIAQAIEKARGARAPLAVARCSTLEEAIDRAKEMALPGDVVLLSPACASYDMFPNFEARGERFRKHVHALTERDVPQAHEVK